MKSNRHRKIRRLPGLCLGLLAIVLWPVGAARAGRRLKTYQSRYYVIHTDLAPADVREAAVRMTAMAEEYHRRTKGFSGTIRRKLPFYLFRSAQDYHAAGGPPGSGGFFSTTGKLMVLAGEKPTEWTFHVIQHEGFHQFAHAAIGGHIPEWVNEGLAEYFGQAIFTGDGFVVGVVPPRRLARLKRQIRAGGLKGLREMMTISRKEWSRDIAIANYDQAWSMIHFLIHGQRGRYVRALGGFVNDLATGLRYETAWVRNFGRDINAFEARWRQYWLDQPADPTRRLYDRAVVATLTSYFARAISQGQRFQGFQEFLKAARAGELNAHRLDWLPPKLLKKALAGLDRVGTWSIEKNPVGRPKLTCTARDGARFIGTFLAGSGRVKRVHVEIRPPTKRDIRQVPARPASRPARRRGLPPGGPQGRRSSRGRDRKHLESAGVSARLWVLPAGAGRVVRARPRPYAKAGGTMSYRTAILGATGAVGTEFLRILQERDFPLASLKLLASARSAGRKLNFRGEELVVEEVGERSFAGIELVLASAGGTVSRKFAPLAASAGAVVVDNTSAFRMDPEVPLVIPEINPEDISRHKGIIANPNCSTIVMNVPVWPLHKARSIRRIVVSTYQAASGAGARAMAELEEASRAMLAGQPFTPKVLPHPAAFNVFCHDSKIGPDGYNVEETKMLRETRKIFHCPEILITATCVRVPVLRAHSEAINLEFTEPLSEAEARRILASAPGLRLVDDRENNYFPMPLDASGTDEILVGRIRRDISQPDGRGIEMFVSGDQIRKGAALNAVQIAEMLTG